MITLFFSILAIIAVGIQFFISALPWVAPDFGIGQIGISKEYSFLTISITIILLSLFYSSIFSQKNSFIKFELKTLGSSLISFIIPIIGMFLFVFYLDGVRCAQSGFCTGGEPFDHMSLIFFVLALVPLGAMLLIETLLSSVVFYAVYASVHKKKKTNAKKQPTQKIPIIIVSCLYVSLFAQMIWLAPHIPTLFRYNSPIQKALQEAITCPPYEHCGSEPLNVSQIITDIKEQPSKELTHYQRWAIALGAMTVEMNGMPHDQVSLISQYRNPKVEIPLLKTMLKDWWDITDRETTLNTLQWLAHEGHSDQYKSFYIPILTNTDLSAQALTDKYLPKERATTNQTADVTRAFQFVITNKEKTGDNLIYAWDYGRFVFVVRSAFSVGYLTETEALTLIEEVGKRVQKRFHSWKEFGENYVIGRKWWTLQLTPSDQTADYLYRTLTAPSGNWSKIPWDWSNEK